jgi:hypothetical protein
MRVSVSRDEGDARRAALQDALIARLAESTARPGQQIQVPDHARPYMRLTLGEMAAEHLGRRGFLGQRDVVGVFERAFHTTSDFPAIFGTAISARLAARYVVAAPSYRAFFGRRDASDFRPQQVIRAGDFPSPMPILESGEIKGGTFSESKELFQVYPYGVTFNLSRQMVVNDNLGAIDQVLSSYADTITAWENAKAFALLTSGAGSNGPTLVTDGFQVFDDTNHNNLAGTPSTIDLTNVQLGRVDMMGQTSLDGIKLNLQPSVLLCGPSKMGLAEQLVSTLAPAQTSNAVPEAVRRLNVVADAHISGSAWYLFADPGSAPVFVFGYLEGNTAPRLSTRDPWSVQGIAVKVEHDFGVAAIDYRGGYRNAGA